MLPVFERLGKADAEGRLFIAPEADFPESRAINVEREGFSILVAFRAAPEMRFDDDLAGAALEVFPRVSGSVRSGDAAVDPIAQIRKGRSG